MYLDPARTQAYLSQFDGGLATLGKSTVSQTVEASAELAAGPAKVGGKHQAQSAYERSVTPTTASQFLNLAGYLDKVGLTTTLPLLAVETKTDASAIEHATAFRTLRSASPGSSAAVHGQRIVEAIGGRVTIVGKVLYRIHPKRRPYRDLETWNRFKPETEAGALPASLADT